MYIIVLTRYWYSLLDLILYIWLDLISDLGHYIWLYRICQDGFEKWKSNILLFGSKDPPKVCLGLFIPLFNHCLNSSLSWVCYKWTNVDVMLLMFIADAIEVDLKKIHYWIYIYVLFNLILHVLIWILTDYQNASIFSDALISFSDIWLFY